MFGCVVAIEPMLEKQVQLSLRKNHFKDQSNLLGFLYRFMEARCFFFSSVFKVSSFFF